MNWQNKIAKEKDNGKYAVLGMMSQCASYFNVDIHSECVKYIVETYLECIDTCDFFEWIRGANPEEQVIVMDKEYLKENFNDLLSYSEDLEVLSDLFMYLYQQEVWIDRTEQVLYSTVFNMSIENRNKFNYIGIAMEYERLATLREYGINNWSDINNFVESVFFYGYDIEEDYEYSTDNLDETTDNIIERMQQIFSL